MYILTHLGVHVCICFTFQPHPSRVCLCPGVSCCLYWSSGWSSCEVHVPPGLMKAKEIKTQINTCTSERRGSCALSLLSTHATSTIRMETPGSFLAAKHTWMSKHPFLAQLDTLSNGLMIKVLYVPYHLPFYFIWRINTPKGQKSPVWYLRSWLLAVSSWKSELSHRAASKCYKKESCLKLECFQLLREGSSRFL